MLSHPAQARCSYSQASLDKTIDKFCQATKMGLRIKTNEVKGTFKARTQTQTTDLNQLT